MDFEIYCDESGLEALSRPDAHKYTLIGGIWLLADYRDQLKKDINAIKEKHHVFGELKWNKLSPRFFEMYREVVDYFFQHDFIRFRVLVVEAEKANELGLHHGDMELQFYKFYYQLLHKWILDFNVYDIFLDLKVNRNKGRLKELHKALQQSNLTAAISQVQGPPSEQSIGIQLADVLTGLVSTAFNKEAKGKAKVDLITHVQATYLKGEIGPTGLAEAKFNIFLTSAQGGW